MKKPALIIIFLISTVLVLSLVKLYISNSVATSGVVLGDTEEKIENLKVENSILSEDVYKYSSLTNIEKKAYALGYIEGKSSYVISQQVPVAIKP